MEGFMEKVDSELGHDQVERKQQGVLSRYIHGGWKPNEHKGVGAKGCGVSLSSRESHRSF